MQLGYLQPFSFQIGARPESKVSGPTVTGVRHGVTEIKLSDRPAGPRHIARQISQGRSEQA